MRQPCAPWCRGGQGVDGQDQGTLPHSPNPELLAWAGPAVGLGPGFPPTGLAAGRVSKP